MFYLPEIKIDYVPRQGEHILQSITVFINFQDSIVVVAMVTLVHFQSKFSNRYHSQTSSPQNFL